MVRKMGEFFTRVMERYLPDAFLFAIILTFISFVLSQIFTDAGFIGAINAWWGGIWSILTFAMQMTLILVTGHSLALAPPVKRLLASIARAANSPAKAVFLVALVGGICSWLQWGFGLIVGGLLAVEIAKRVEDVDYPLLIAAAYAGFLTWHMGISGSAPLTIASAGNAANHIERLTGRIVPVTETMFASWNLWPAMFLIVSVAALLAMAIPARGKAKPLSKEAILILEEEEKQEEAERKNVRSDTWAQRIENSLIINYLFAAMGVVYLVNYFIEKGFTLDLNLVIGIFLFLGLILHERPINYVRAVNKAIKGAGGIALQFPLYGGIQGLMMGTGLASVIAGWFVAISSTRTFYMLQFWAAGLLNVFIPSGGGQWAAQGAITVEAAQMIGQEPVKAAMMVAWGDQWTNMIQPFWALPLLGLANLKARDIMGYTTLVVIWAGVVLSVVALLIA
ncbi:MAG: Short-chain fatty acids transporter [Firmicutes bacterium ADurb.Bin506]|jgi:short-chain fatty acids transporter|nr:MAG: Short-chain fatty acids transporter [Firmicutes bacterium ADurb.Bin506]